VGFALETENGIASARKKLADKQCDLIVLNNPTEEGSGFGTDTNAVTFVTADGGVEALPLRPKIEVAHTILTRVALLRSRIARG
jgi:phosphopantothenoylcysteine decarboxylase/phosphopantothenate--cysteine ligase